VQALTELGGGFWLVTPLRTEAGWTVLVNRGFVPFEREAATKAGAEAPAGPVTITGLLRPTEPGGGFLQHNDPAHDQWFSRDVAAIAAARGIGPAAPYFIDADDTPNQGGYPVGGLTVIAFRNAHLVYALTWFSLAVMSVAGLWILHRGRSAAKAA
jgi:surfeit locus 1 family protein